MIALIEQLLYNDKVELLKLKKNYVILYTIDMR